MALWSVLALTVVTAVRPAGGAAQDKALDPSKHKHADKSADADKDLAAQVRDLQTKIARLEAALKQGEQGAPSASTDAGGTATGMTNGKKMGKGMMGMDGMMMGGGAGGKKKAMTGMGMMDDDEGEMAGMGMASGGTGMMDDDMDMMGMMGMGGMGGGGSKGMKGMGQMKVASALPGFPGASHLYHIGATGFFLDHPEHVTLTTKQQTTLNRIKQKARLGRTKHQRKIDDAELELWELTGADEPEVDEIQAKAQEIEKLRTEQRLAVIRAVGEAAQVLTEEQREALLGQVQSDKSKHSSHAAPAK
jgi:TolA-binding protein